MSRKISSDLGSDLGRLGEEGMIKYRRRRKREWLALPLLVIMVCFHCKCSWLLISFLYDSQSARLKYAICSQQLEDDECQDRSNKSNLNEADLRAMAYGEQHFLSPLPRDKAMNVGKQAIPHPGQIKAGHPVHTRTITNTEAQYIFIRWACNQ